jgi:hypothetical protein
VCSEPYVAGDFLFKEDGSFQVDCRKCHRRAFECE